MGYQRQLFKTIPSTNSYLKEKAENLDSPLFLRALYQSQGKGRENRIWQAEEGKNLLFSLLIKERGIVEQAGFLSLVASTCIASVFESSLGLEGVSIKWPNDIYINGKKAVGILLEGRVPEYIVIGMGVNVNQKQFLGEYRIAPTSLSLELGREIHIDSLEKAIEDSLYDCLYLNPREKPHYLEFYRSHDYLKGREAKSSLTGEKGVILGVDEGYRLLLKTSKGILSLESGEVDLH